MAALSAKLRSVSFDAAGTKTGVSFWCPGCARAHSVCTTGGNPAWCWDGDVDRPTLSPSVLVWSQLGADGTRLPEGQLRTLCHSFVEAGQIRFLGDSAHALAGQTVPLPDWPP